MCIIFTSHNFQNYKNERVSAIQKRIDRHWNLHLPLLYCHFISKSFNSSHIIINYYHHSLIAYAIGFVLLTPSLLVVMDDTTSQCCTTILYMVRAWVALLLFIYLFIDSCVFINSNYQLSHLHLTIILAVTMVSPIVQNIIYEPTLALKRTQSFWTY